jgi:hypothetical protein
LGAGVKYQAHQTQKHKKNAKKLSAKSKSKGHARSGNLKKNVL